MRRIIRLNPNPKGNVNSNWSRRSSHCNVTEYRYDGSIVISNVDANTNPNSSPNAISNTFADRHRDSDTHANPFTDTDAAADSYHDG